jgi:hypothetical protein
MTKNKQGSTCSFCHGEVHPTRSPKCPACAAKHHRDCWNENKGCSVYGCEASPDLIEKNGGYVGVKK